MLKNIPLEAILIEELLPGEVVYIEADKKRVRMTIEDVDYVGLSFAIKEGTMRFISNNATYWGGASTLIVGNPLPGATLGYDGIWDNWEAVDGKVRFKKSGTTILIKEGTQNNILYKNTKYSFVKLMNGTGFKIENATGALVVDCTMCKVFLSESDLDMFLNPGKTEVDIPHARKKFIKGTEKAIIESSPVQEDDYVSINKEKFSAETNKNYALQEKLQSATDYQDVFQVDYVSPVLSKNRTHIVALEKITGEVDTCYCKKITKEEYRKRIAEQKYAKLGQRYAKIIKDNLAGEERNLSQLQMALIQKTREVNVLEMQCKKDVVEFGKFATQAIEAAKEKLQKNKSIASVRFSDSDFLLTVTTQPLFIRKVWKDGKDITKVFGDSIPLEIGTYEINYNVLNSNYTVKHLKPAKDIVKGHSHLKSSNDMCIGDMQGLFNKSIAVFDYVTATRILLETLEQVNESSTTMRFYYFWKNYPKHLIPS